MCAAVLLSYSYKKKNNLQKWCIVVRWWGLFTFFNWYSDDIIWYIFSQDCLWKTYKSESSSVGGVALSRVHQLFFVPHFPRRCSCCLRREKLFIKIQQQRQTEPSYIQTPGLTKIYILLRSGLSRWLRSIRIKKERCLSFSRSEGPWRATRFFRAALDETNIRHVYTHENLYLFLSTRCGFFLSYKRRIHEILSQTFSA